MFLIKPKLHKAHYIRNWTPSLYIDGISYMKLLTKDDQIFLFVKTGDGRLVLAKV